jgi:hypothetical protein
MKQIVSMAAVLVAMALASTASAQVQTGSILVRATDEQAGARRAWRSPLPAACWSAAR